MAWEVAVILSTDCNESTVVSLATYMPIWIADTPSNQRVAALARKAAGDLWSPDPACTTFYICDELDRERNFIEVAETVDLHHPHVTKLNLLGLEDTPTLRSHMSSLGFITAVATWDGTIAFRKPLSALANVPQFALDARRWRSVEDVYDALFEILGSPAWHGKNFQALYDSIVTGQINRMEVPYILSIQGISSAKPEVRLFVRDLVDLISKFEAQGCPVGIRVENP
jgi:hypothetical protein